MTILRCVLSLVLALSLGCAGGATVMAPKKPPPDRAEEEGRKPGAGVFWSDGYWMWNADKQVFYWVGGRWIEERKGWVYQPGGWEPAEQDGKRVGWRFVPATWIRESELDRTPPIHRRRD